jgi:hypothetical protein
MSFIFNAKLADARDLKSAGPKRPVGVRFPLPAPVQLVFMSLEPSVQQLLCSILGMQQPSQSKLTA